METVVTMIMHLKMRKVEDEEVDEEEEVARVWFQEPKEASEAGPASLRLKENQMEMNISLQMKVRKNLKLFCLTTGLMKLKHEERLAEMLKQDLLVDLQPEYK